MLNDPISLKFIMVLDYQRNTGLGMKKEALLQFGQELLPMVDAKIANFWFPHNILSLNEWIFFKIYKAHDH